MPLSNTVTTDHKGKFSSDENLASKLKCAGGVRHTPDFENLV